MTPQEIVKQVQKLPRPQQREVLEALSQNVGNQEKKEISEAEVAEILLEQGIISQIPSHWNEPDEDFEPITIKGKPLSETILEDRN